MSTTTRKPTTYKAGIWSLRLLIAAIAAAGVNAWYHASSDLLSQIATMGAASLTALTLMFCVEAIGRAWATVCVIPVLIICAAMQMVTFEKSEAFYVEAPHKAEFEKQLEPLAAEVTRTTNRLVKAQSALDAFQPETVDCSPCRLTKQDAAARDEKRRAPLAEAVTTATADKAAADLAYRTKADAYTPQADPAAVLVVGGLIDLSIALAIWALEAAARRAKREATKVAEREALRKAEADRLQQAEERAHALKLARQAARAAEAAEERREARRITRAKEKAKRLKEEAKNAPAPKPQRTIAETVLSEGEKAFFGLGLRLVVNNVG